MRFLKKIQTVLIAVLALTLSGCTAASAAAVAEPETVTAICYMDAPEQEYLQPLITTPLYTVEAGKFIPGLAQMPVDITAEYAGNMLYGIPAGAQRGYAFRITLQQNVFREDGAPVTAEDILSVVKTQTEAFSWLANAEGFLAGLERPAEDVISLQEAGFDTIVAAQEAGYSRFYVDLAHFWGLEAGWEPVTDRQRIKDHAMPSGLNELYVTASYLYRNYLAEGSSLSYLQSEFVGVTAVKEPLSFADVGVLKTGDYEIVLISAEAMTAETVAARLLRVDLLGEDLNGAYGPYRVAYAGPDEIRLERNEYWQAGTAEYSADVIRCLQG